MSTIELAILINAIATGMVYLALMDIKVLIKRKTAPKIGTPISELTDEQLTRMRLSFIHFSESAVDDLRRKEANGLITDAEYRLLNAIDYNERMESARASYEESKKQVEDK